MSNDAALQLFESLKNATDLQALITRGQAEGMYLECKILPSPPSLDADAQKKLSEAISGFSNTEGGIFIFGVSTTKQPNGADVITGIVEIGDCQGVAHQIEIVAPTMTIPAVTALKVKSILIPGKGGAGVVIIYIPKTQTDPVRSAKNNIYFFRNGDSFTPLPHEILKRLFATVYSPDVGPFLAANLVTLKNGQWKIPVVLENKSISAARDVKIVVEILNADVCESVEASSMLNDASQVNPGRKIFISKDPQTILKGLNAICGSLNVKMKKVKREKRLLKLQVKIVADKMEPRTWDYTINLNKSGFVIKNISQKKVV